jgi:hypothetical protein
MTMTRLPVPGVGNLLLYAEMNIMQQGRNGRKAPRHPLGRGFLDCGSSEEGDHEAAKKVRF